MVCTKCLCIFSTLLVTTSNGVRSIFSQFSDCPRAWATAILCKQTFNTYQSQSQSYTITADIQSAICLGVGHSSGPPTNFSPLSLIIFRQLRVCWCRAPSLTRNRVCSFQFLLGITSASFLRSQSHGTHRHIVLYLLLRLTQPVRVKVTLRPTVSRPARLGIRRPFGPPTNFSFSLRFSFRQLQFAPNLEGQVTVFISPRNKVAQLYPRAFGLSN
jgi:hypothetical protein